ncbi:MAG: dienelactone hydrolase family protein [Bacteroidetes bacterium]|nr:dienelactone hydrolase family protein [Bacteroidota bacterium]MCL2302641.1 dienelactone hydrolase family protein [Lentimicrobiaceae bacterium]
MKKLISIFLLLIVITAFGQTKTPEDFGFRHIVYKYKNDNVDILIKSKKGEENVKKPLFFFCQGSLPIPLIKYDEYGGYGVFPFIPDSLSEKYHLVIVSKPYIPVMAEIKTLSENYCTYVDSTGKVPKEYSDKNLLSYYVQRNIAVIKHLQKQKWVSPTQLVVAGHSEGSSIAAKMATECNKITHLIYSGGNPLGRVMSIIGQNRARETDTDSTRFGERSMRYWEKVVKNKNCMDNSHGDTDKTTFDFSYPPPIKHLEKLKIPVLITYGTKDESAPFNDFLHVETIRQGKKNFTFKAYIGTDHNFYPLTEDNKPNFDIYNWGKVADDWLEWLNEN